MSEEGCGPLWDGSSKVLLKMKGRGVLQDLIPDVGQLELPMFLFRDGSLTLIYMASLMVLVMMSASPPTMEKLSTLM